jgi:hypothetical protein
MPALRCNIHNVQIPATSLDGQPPADSIHDGSLDFGFGKCFQAQGCHNKRVLLRSPSTFNLETACCALCVRKRQQGAHTHALVRLISDHSLPGPRVCQNTRGGSKSTTRCATVRGGCQLRSICPRRRGSGGREVPRCRIGNRTYSTRHTSLSDEHNDISHCDCSAACTWSSILLRAAGQILAGMADAIAGLAKHVLRRESNLRACQAYVMRALVDSMIYLIAI